MRRSLSPSGGGVFQDLLDQQLLDQTRHKPHPWMSMSLRIHGRLPSESFWRAEIHHVHLKSSYFMPFPHHWPSQLVFRRETLWHQLAKGCSTTLRNLCNMKAALGLQKSGFNWMVQVLTFIKASTVVVSTLVPCVSESGSWWGRGGWSSHN